MRALGKGLDTEMCMTQRRRKVGFLGDQRCALKKAGMQDKLPSTNFVKSTPIGQIRMSYSCTTQDIIESIYIII